MVAPAGMVVVADLPNVPPKSPTHWVPANATFAKPEPIQEFVFMHGTKMPANTFEELWTVEEQEHLIVEVQKWLKKDAKSNGDASTWSGLFWKGVTWSSVKGPFNSYFKGVTQPMGTPLAKPYQLVGVVVLGRNRLFVDRTWKNLKDRSVLIWEIIAPDFVKPKPEPLQKLVQSAPDMRPARPDTTSSSLTSTQSSDDDFASNPPRPHMPAGPTKDQLAWRVDDNNQALDHQNLKPKLPRPAYTERSEALQARFVAGGPCYICKAHESLDVWRQSLYMKVPVLKTTVFKRVKAKEDESYQKKPEDYEVYCTDCYQRDYKARSIASGPCGKCGRTESCEEWYENLFLQDPTGTVFCSHCYTADYNDRHQQLTRKHNDMHDLCKGQKVDYGDGKAKEPFWEGLHRTIPKDVATNSIFNPRNQVHPNRTSTGRAIGKTSNLGQAEGDTNATIDDETIEDLTTSFADRTQASMQKELQFSSGPDDESCSPRITRRRPAAKASMEAFIPSLGRPGPHPTQAAIPDYRGPPARQGRRGPSETLYRPVATPSRDMSATPVRGHPLFREADARRQAASQDTATILTLSGPASSQSRQATGPPSARPPANQKGQASIPVLGGPMPMPIREAAAGPEAVESMLYSMLFGGGGVPVDDDSDEKL